MSFLIWAAKGVVIHAHFSTLTVFSILMRQACARTCPSACMPNARCKNARDPQEYSKQFWLLNTRSLCVLFNTAFCSARVILAPMEIAKTYSHICNICMMLPNEGIKVDRQRFSSSLIEYVNFMLNILK